MFVHIPPDTFLREGYNMIGRQVSSCPITFTATSTQRFCSTFGVNALICTQLWYLIGINAGENLIRTALPKHLLWSLLLLKQYNSTEIASAIAGVDEKTYRKWSWIFVHILADLNDVVSKVCLDMSILLMRLNIYTLHNNMDVWYRLNGRTAT